MRETRLSGLMQGRERVSGLPIHTLLPTLPRRYRHRPSSRRLRKHPSRRRPAWPGVPELRRGFLSLFLDSDTGQNQMLPAA